ncbi:MAG: outer membrane protein assembly factor BamB family protein [Endomicrobiales bacterium]
MKRIFQAMPRSLLFLSIALFGAGYIVLSQTANRNGQGRRAGENPALMSYAPLVAGSRVYYSGRDGTAYALDATSGRVLWKQEEGQQAAGRDSGPAAGALGQGMLFLPGREGEVTALDATGGEVRWKRKVTESGAPAGSPVYSGGTVFVPVPGDILALDATTGRLRWRLTAAGKHGPGLVIESSLAVDPVTQTLFFSASAAPGASGSLVAVDARTGEMKWKQEA